MGQTDNPGNDPDDPKNLYLNFWYDPVTDQVIYQLIDGWQDEPSEMECDNCGKTGASPRADGSFMCSHCWAVWNG